METNKFETFYRLKPLMLFLGFLPFQNLSPWCKKFPIGSIHCGGFFIILILFVWCTSWFLIFEEKTFDEVSDSVFFTAQSVLYLVLYSIFYRTKRTLIDLFQELAKLIAKSELFVCFIIIIIKNIHIR